MLFTIFIGAQIVGYSLAWAFEMNVDKTMRVIYCFIIGFMFARITTLKEENDELQNNKR